MRERTREEEGSIPINPFLAALKTANPPPAASSNNVFLQQAASIVTRQQGEEEDDDDEPVDEATMVTSRPLSYAGAVKSNVPRTGVNPFLAAQSSSIPSSQSLHLKGVPDHLNNKQFLWQHFEKFGPLNDVNCHPEKKYADVHFKTQVNDHHFSLSPLPFSLPLPLSLYMYIDVLFVFFLLIREGQY